MPSPALSPPRERAPEARVTVTLRIGEEVYDAIRRLALREDRTANNWIARFLTQHPQIRQEIDRQAR